MQATLIYSALMHIFFRSALHARSLRILQAWVVRSIEYVVLRHTPRTVSTQGEPAIPAIVGQDGACI